MIFLYLNRIKRKTEDWSDGRKKEEWNIGIME